MYSPWVIYYRQIEAMFKKDPEVKVEYDDDDDSNYTIKLRVNNNVKAEALRKILPAKKVFGNVEVSVIVIPANGVDSRVKYIEDAFKGNEAFSHMTTVSYVPGMYISNPITYCSFKKEVVQYAADDLGSETGLTSTLYQDIAKEIFDNMDGVFFCTDAD